MKEKKIYTKKKKLGGWIAQCGEYWEEGYSEKDVIEKIKEKMKKDEDEYIKDWGR